MKYLYCRFCFDSSAAIVASPKGSICRKFKICNKIGSKDFFKHVSNINSTLGNCKSKVSINISEASYVTSKNFYVNKKKICYPYLFYLCSHFSQTLCKCFVVSDNKLNWRKVNYLFLKDYIEIWDYGQLAVELMKWC